ncbi:tRNA-splicing endonuclease subunit Sen34 [Homalodisca vitripennis]|uniref:tRNA-splicing endonuclease subunit Sen34 n=1 Tax=Homalodisca vitripennis TaxID=197043 RepID=UPI001EEB1A1C|nr:tRNA-splicing endonuclease subunit Sen34 [Homalodisca vitripennis]
MISIVLQNDSPLVWKASDWIKIREEHRIVGSLIGCLVGLPRQDTFQGLPLMLLKEEVTLLLEKNLACVISDSALSQRPDDQSREKYSLYKEENKKEQLQCYEAQRKEQITSLIDRIIEGKRRKRLGLSTKKKKINDQDNSNSEETLSSDFELDRDEILKIELNKSSASLSPPLLVQTFLSEHWTNESEETVKWRFPETSHERLRYSTFKDLWEKGFYITEGHKFGVDYLVYPGDPVKFHAQFLVVCKDYNETFSTVDFISYARLGSISRKTFVIATKPSDSENVVYQSIQWAEKSQ